MSDELAHLMDRRRSTTSSSGTPRVVDDAAGGSQDRLHPGRHPSTTGRPGIRGSLPRWESGWPPFSLLHLDQHLVLNRAVNLTPGAETATAHCDFSNPNGREVDGKPWLFVVGGAYHDRLVATPAGWRIAHRVEETLWWTTRCRVSRPHHLPFPATLFCSAGQPLCRN